MRRVAAAVGARRPAVGALAIAGGVGQRCRFDGCRLDRAGVGFESGHGKGQRQHQDADEAKSTDHDPQRCEHRRVLITDHQQSRRRLAPIRISRPPWASSSFWRRLTLHRRRLAVRPGQRRFGDGEVGQFQRPGVSPSGRPPRPGLRRLQRLGEDHSGAGGADRRRRNPSGCDSGTAARLHGRRPHPDVNWNDHPGATGHTPSGSKRGRRPRLNAHLRFDTLVTDEPRPAPRGIGLLAVASPFDVHKGEGRTCLEANSEARSPP